jgi:hypothetical protein
MVLGTGAYVVCVWFSRGESVGKLCVLTLYLKEKGNALTIDRCREGYGTRAAGIDMAEGK